MDKRDLINRLFQLRPKLEQRGIAHLAIYGSRAWGTPRSDSDLDLVFDVEAGRKFSLIDLISAERLVSEATGIETYVFVRGDAAPDFESRIARDSVQIF
jgi:hypothetical protein